MNIAKDGKPDYDADFLKYITDKKKYINALLNLDTKIKQMFLDK